MENLSFWGLRALPARWDAVFRQPPSSIRMLFFHPAGCGRADGCAALGAGWQASRPAAAAGSVFLSGIECSLSARPASDNSSFLILGCLSSLLLISW